MSLGLGELPIRQGYTARVFADMSNLIERVGSTKRGSITAVYSILLHDEMEADPLAHEIRGLLDGHIRLSEELSLRGIYPAYDIMHSLSRLSHRIIGKEHAYLLGQLRANLSSFLQYEEAFLFQERDEETYRTRQMLHEELESLYSQELNEEVSLPETLGKLRRLQAIFEHAQEPLSNNEIN